MDSKLSRQTVRQQASKTLASLESNECRQPEILGYVINWLATMQRTVPDALHDTMLAARGSGSPGSVQGRRLGAGL